MLVAALTSWTRWEQNEALMNSSCTAFGVTNNSPSENEDILDAIGKESAASGVDKRFILAVIVSPVPPNNPCCIVWSLVMVIADKPSLHVQMQESKGCVRVATTYSPGAAVRNPGLMQDHNGAGTCAGSTTCDATEITQMVKDGVTGTASGDGLEQW